MRSLERHRDVAAYALGVLDEAEAFRFEDHLMECASCSAQVTEFGPVTRQLLLYRRATPRFVHPLAAPGDRVLDRLLTEIGRRRRSARRRLLYAVAAALVVGLTAPAVAVLSSGGEGAAPLSATDPRSGVWAQVTTHDEDWGSQVQLKVKDAAGTRSCRLVVIGRDGSEQTVSTWSAPGGGGRTATMEGSAAFHPDQIARYEVRTTDGHLLVTLRPEQ
ncbi:zf-HC2 domain-containing protein [Streptomyces sp. NPDC058731]|uniref:zf-HC2 domain-containing protein n=1 Tax=Streptomyces sp. NPDC058731 TaxID=3346613 RepID=UPI0036A3DB34